MPETIRVGTSAFTAADFTYVRLLGDRKGIEEITKTWDKIVVDRNRDMET